MEAESTYHIWKFALALILSGGLSTLFLILGWLRRKSSTNPAYLIVLLNLSLWMFLYAACLITGNPQAHLFLSQLEFIARLFLPLAWLIFALDLSGMKGWRSPLSFILTLLAPVILIIITFGGFEPRFTPDLREFLALPGAGSLQMSPSKWEFSWLVLYYVYTLVYLLLATFLVINIIIRSPRFNIRHGVILSLGVLLPWLGHFTFIFHVSPIPGLDVSPFVYAISGVFLFWGLNYDRFSFIVSSARRLVVDRMTEGWVVLDDRNLLLDLNTASCGIFGVTDREVTGRRAEDVFGNWPDLVDSLRYESRKNQNIEVRNGGGRAFYQMDINPLFDRDGKVMGKMLVFHDVTPLKQAEIKLMEAKTRAEQSENLKSAFLANMSHEIRTPMNVIIGFSNLLNDKDVSEDEREEFIGHIKNSGNSLLQLIDDIIDISKLDAGQIVVERSRISVTRLLAELFSYFNEYLNDLDKPDIQLMVTGIGDNIDWTLVADGVKINRVLRHLLDNAVKFTSQGFIEFGARPGENDTLVFYVQDSGIGIAREKQGMIFERFSRIMTGTRQEYGGTGMGLAICKGMTELMGGKIWVESVLGIGSTFYVSLPVSQVEKKPMAGTLLDIYGKPAPPIPVPAAEVPVEPGLIATPSGTGEADGPENWSTRLALVIEPEELVYLNIEMIVRPTRLNLIWAKSLAEASNFLEKSNPVDCVIASMQLADVTANEIIDSLREKLPDTPVIALVPYEGSGIDKKCRELGCADSIPKPILPVRLLRTLGHYLS